MQPEEMVDWLGRRLPSQEQEEEEEEEGIEHHREGGQTRKTRRIGGWRAASFILGTIGLGFFTFGGIFFNLVLYLIREWHTSNANAANDVTNILGTTFLMGVLGAFIGDAYLGRIWTTILFLVIYTMGCILLSVVVTIQQHDASKSQSMSMKAFLFVSLYVIAIGNGSYEPTLASLGGDQFCARKDKATFFNWYYVASSVGQLLSLTLLTYFENEGRWALGFSIAAGSILFSLVLFLVGAPQCQQQRASGNPLIRIVQVFTCSFRNILKRHSNMPTITLHEIYGGTNGSMDSHKLPHTQGFRWLDKAAEKIDDSIEPTSPWKVCTVTQVEEVKCLLRISPFLLIGIIFNMLIAQLTTLFIEQAALMDGSLGNEFTLPPGSMRVFTLIFTIIFPLFYNYFIVAWLKGRTSLKMELTMLQRMGLGLAMSILSMVVAALIEKKRLKVASMNSDPLSMFWLVPQFAIVGIALALENVSRLEFFYSQVSISMRSLGLSLPLICVGLGNYGSTLLLTIVTKATTKGGNKLGWIPANLNKGHVDYFYYLLAIVMFISLIFFLISTYFYYYLDPSPQHDIEQRSGSFRNSQ